MPSSARRRQARSCSSPDPEKSLRNKIDLRKLPPLNALKGFEATTRRESVREAAEELCLTHPAVSYQIQVLEQDLGVQLFSRTGRALVPTAEGRQLYQYVRSALETLIEGTETVRRTKAGTPLRVQTYVTASIRWLARKLPGFVALHPDIRLQLSTCAFEWDFDESSADVGLVYCAEPPGPEYHWVPLFDYTLYPVCSPALADSLGAAPAPDSCCSCRWSRSTASSTTGTSGSRPRGCSTRPGPRSWSTRSRWRSRSRSKAAASRWSTAPMPWTTSPPGGWCGRCSTRSPARAPGA